MEIIKDIIDILQGLVIIGATLFTVKWTYKTFAHKERIDELKELKRTIELYHWKIQIFCMQVRDNAVPDQKELDEKVELAGLHNKLVELKNLSLYNDPKFREKVQNIVGGWLISKRLEKMQHRTKAKVSEKGRVELWKQFDKEYKEVTGLIDMEAKKYIG
jgi:hypothetical protein